MNASLAAAPIGKIADSDKMLTSRRTLENGRDNAPQNIL